MAMIHAQAGGAVRLSALASDGLTEALARMFGEIADLAERAADSPVGAGGGIMVLELAEPGAHQLMERIAAERPETPCLVVGDDLPAPAVRALLKLKTTDVISRSANDNDILNAVKRLSEAQPASDEPEREGSCWVMTPAVGGAGATTLAIELACAVAAHEPASDVCLIDLNINDGMLAAFLEGKSKLDLAAFAEQPQRLDRTLLEAFCWTHETGVSLIAAQRDPDIHERMTPQAILQLLEVACGSFNRVIIDLPRQRQAWTKPILAGVDEVFVVSEFTVPSLHAAAEMVGHIDELRGAAPPAKFLLNRMVSGKSAFSVSEAEAAIGHPMDVIVRSDWQSARMAVNLGMPVASVKAKSPLVEDVQKLVATLLPHAVEAQPKKKGLLW